MRQGLKQGSGQQLARQGVKQESGQQLGPAGSGSGIRKKKERKAMSQTDQTAGTAATSSETAEKRQQISMEIYRLRNEKKELQGKMVRIYENMESLQEVRTALSDQTVIWDNDVILIAGYAVTSEIVLAGSFLGAAATDLKEEFEGSMAAMINTGSHAGTLVTEITTQMQALDHSRDMVSARISRLDDRINSLRASLDSLPGE